MTHFAKATSDHKGTFSSMIRCNGCIQNDTAVAYKGTLRTRENSFTHFFQYI